MKLLIRVWYSGLETYRASLLASDIRYDLWRLNHYLQIIRWKMLCKLKDIFFLRYKY